MQVLTLCAIAAEADNDTTAAQNYLYQAAEIAEFKSAVPSRWLRRYFTRHSPDPLDRGGRGIARQCH